MEKTSGSEAKERIINAAVELFSQKGYDVTRVNDIASTATVEMSGFA